MDLPKSRSRRRPRHRIVATAMAAAAAAASASSGVASSLHSVEAAFSTPTFTSRTLHPISSARLPSHAEGSASKVGDTALRLRQGPLHMQSCGAPHAATTMAADELLDADISELKLPKFTALQNVGSMQRHKNGRLGSLSGRYGGLGSGDTDSGSSTSLQVSQSSNMLGFQVGDFEQDEDSNINEIYGDFVDMQFALEDFDLIEEKMEVVQGKDMGVRAVGPNTSPASQWVASSLLKSVAKNKAIRIKNSNNRSERPPAKSKTKSKSKLIGDTEDLPPWFPWVPTESQINSLRVAELRAACSKRDIATTGKKAELQQRLLIWATAQERIRVKDRLSGLKDLLELSKSKDAGMADAATREIDQIVEKYDAESYNVDSLTNKRKALTKGKKRSRGGNNRGILGLVDESYFNTTASIDEEDDDEDEYEYDSTEDNSMITSASLTRLSQTFEAPASTYTNSEVREMYIEAKFADQTGGRTRSKAILSELRTATPHDMRVVRRLARMEMEDGNLSKARDILNSGLNSFSDNVHLIHGLGQLERKAGNDHTAKAHFRRAIGTDPMFANPYHALGTLEHTHGNIRAALTVIKEGIKNCPTNHRLHHALGDVYLDANMLDLAEESYLEGIRHGPDWSKSFFYTSLSFVSYAQGHTRDARTLLHQSIEVGGGMHAQGVVALAQLEESEGNIQEARKVYQDAVSRYERKRRDRTPYRHRSANNDGLVERYTRRYSGDKWMNVFLSWARMEEIHGSYKMAHIVLGKAARMFPGNIGLLIKWADLQIGNGKDGAEKAQLLYEAACHRSGGRSAEPYRKLAIFEMKRKKFTQAQSVLLRGAQAIAKESPRSLDGSGGLAQLFHTWGVCEYHLGSLTRAQELFDDALRATGSEGGDFSAMRSLILYSMAKLEFARGEHLLAQHCIALSLKENLMPGGNSLLWKLWYQIAQEMGNIHLATRCKEQALLRYEEEQNSGTMVSDLSRLLGGREDAKSSNGRLPEKTGSALKGVTRKSPWYNKVCPPSGRMDKDWYSGAKLWELGAAARKNRK